MDENRIGKKAETKLKEWLDRPEEGYSLDRIPDQLSGFYGSKNICDFVCFKSPKLYYIESKATENDRFDFSMISEYQHDSLLTKSTIYNVYGLVVVLFVTYKRAFIVDIRDIKQLEDQGKHSLNILKLDKWDISHFSEIPTIESRKQLLDYTGDLDELVTW